MKNQRQAIGYALTAVLMWSTVASAFKITLSYFEPIQMVLIASLTSIVLLGGIAFYQGKIHLLGRIWRSNPWLYLGLGLINPLCYYLVLFGAYNLLPASQAQPLNYTWAITLTLLAVPLLKQKLQWVDGIAILLGYMGALVIATRGHVLALQFDDNLGVALALLSTLLWAGYWILNTRAQGDPIVSLLLCFLISLPFTLIANTLLADFRMHHWQGWLGGIYIGLFEMGLAFICWLTALQRARNTAQISNLIFISPFISLWLISLILGEAVPAASWIGLALIVTALLLQQMLRRPEPESRENKASI